MVDPAAAIFYMIFSDLLSLNLKLFIGGFEQGVLVSAVPRRNKPDETELQFTGTEWFSARPEVEVVIVRGSTCMR